VINEHVGARLRERRRLLNLSQGKLGASVGGLSHQTVQKYECGRNRMNVATLYHFALALGVDVGYFFEGLER
jgi:transcriptional regulator with XRE-family HTH domain